MVRSLRARLILWFVLIELVLVVAAGAIVHRRVTRALLNGMDAELENLVHDLAAALEERGLEGFESDLGTLWWEHFDEGEDLYLQINTVDGTLIRRSASAGEDTLDFPNDWASRARPGEQDEGFDHIGDEEVRAIRLRLDREAGQDLVLQIAMETEGLRDRQEDSLEYVLLLGAALLLLSGIGGALLATFSLRPVKRLARDVRSVSEESLDERVRVRRLPSELRPVARAFNETMDRLEAAFRREREFTADASHELRTPVTVLLSACDVALQNERTPGEYVEALETCRAAAERMRGMVEQLMALAHLQRGGSALHRDTVNLGDLIDETVEMLRPMAEREGVKIAWSSLDEPALMRGDPERLQEMIINLLSNAILHNRRGGRAEVRLERDDASESIRIAVEDDGPGIPADHLPHIFERFHRVDLARSRERGGGGLGLPIAQAIAQAHGGSIDCSSEEGKGARFTVHLPRG